MNKQLQNKGECWQEPLEEGQRWEECSKIRQQLCKGQEEKEHRECRGMTMLGFWVNMKRVGLGLRNRGKPQKGFEQERAKNSYFTSQCGRPPEKQEVVHTLT